jgi:quercetin dioxygenase-like cupin family protein
MAITRMYTGDDGESHIEEICLESYPELAAGLTASSITFRSYEPGHFLDWHTGPRRQFVITVAGEGEIGLGDGSLHRFGPGHVNLVEDTTGRGHTTCVVSDVPRITATVPVD